MTNIQEVADDGRRDGHYGGDLARTAAVRKKKKPSMVVNALAIAFFSYIGVSIRIGLQEMSDYDSFPSFPAFYAECLGAVFLSFLVMHKLLVQTTAASFYLGIGTGMCGSLTTFSSWQDSAVKALVGWDSDESTFHNILTSFTFQFQGMTGVYISFILGIHLAKLSIFSNQAMLDKTGMSEDEFVQSNLWPKVKFQWAYHILGCVALNVICIPLLVINDKWEILFAFLFAPFGSLMRFGLSFLNLSYKPIPLGTLLANLLGSLLLACVTIVREHYDCFDNTSRPELYDGILSGLGLGFCGTLTTVSTFVAELNILPLKRAYIYGGGSIILAQVITFFTYGAYKWSYQAPWEPCT